MASNRRERELARLRAERQAARRAAEAAARRRRLTVLGSALGVVVLVVAVALIVNATRDKSTTTASASPSASSTAGGPCTYTAGGTAAKQVSLPPATPTVSGPVTATITTNQGAVGVTLDGAKAPCTTNALVSLASQKYFDGTPCHRLTSGGLNVLQCGDPTGTGSGGPGYAYKDENLTGATYKAGTVAMANSGPNTNGSQFFLVYADSQLDPNYTPVGQITSGLDVLTKIAAGGEDPAGDGKPKLPVTITSFTTDAPAAAPSTPAAAPATPAATPSP